MANTAVTNSTIAALNALVETSKIAATKDADGGAEVFEIIPTRPGHSCALIIGGTGSLADGDIAVSVAAGTAWAGAAVTGTVTKNKEAMIQLETAKVLNDGKILVTLTPAATDKLKTDHSAYVKFIELR